MKWHEIPAAIAWVAWAAVNKLWHIPGGLREAAQHKRDMKRWAELGYPEDWDPTDEPR
jgi:hypothetical protein